MNYNLNQDLFQTYSNENETVKIEILYNNSFDYFYFNVFKDGVMIQGDTRIVNNYENDHLKLSSLKADYANYTSVDSFKVEFKS